MAYEITDFDFIGHGDKVTIVDRFGKRHTGKAVMRGPAGWVLNMGGRYGTPGIATPENFLFMKKPRTKVFYPKARKGTGRYANGYRVYGNGSYREDFGSDM